MTLTSGDRLGHYEVIGELGAGGMGVVLRARDTKLDREVALKVLPEAFTADPDRLSRFEREARVLASLNHPNIGGIHGIEDSTDTKALVLELVEGPTLADLIDGSPLGRSGRSSDRPIRGAEAPRLQDGEVPAGLPTDDAIAIARQIAEALEAAHEAGVIHRDLKPANVKVREDGTVKVLDFGLAKALQGEASDPAVSASPTISLTAAATQMGMIIGTAAYMAPEQARGRPVDRRADIWAFGAVLYEMLTGARAFSGEDVSETLAHVITKPLDLSGLPADLPPAVRRIVERCLERDPKRRLRDIGEARIALEEPAATDPAPAQSEAETVEQPDRWRRLQPLAITLVAVLGLVSALAIWVQRPRPEPRLVSRAVMSAAPSAPVAVTANYNDVAITPDGSRIIYQGGTIGESQLLVRALDELEAVPLRGAERGMHPFVSPDGESVGFTDGESLLRVAIGGGPRVTIVEELPALLRGATWGDDGAIIIGVGSGDGLFQVPATGGELTRITGSADGRHLWPSILPGGTHVLFTVSPSAGTRDDRIALLDLATGEHEVIIENGTVPRYASSGHIVYGFEGTLRAAPFDLGRLEVTGDPVPLVEGVLTKGNVAAAAYALDDAGSLVFITGTSTNSLSEQTPVWIDADGTESPLPIPPAMYSHPRLSPDGTRVALRQESSDGFSLWVHETGTGAELRLTRGGNASEPVWAPDGSSLFFSWEGQAEDGQSTVRGIYRIASDGSGTPEPVLAADGPLDFLTPTSVSPDGTALIVRRASTNNLGAIVDVSLTDESAHRTLVEATSLNGGGVLDPTGEWLAYYSEQTGDLEVYVRPYPGPGPVVPVSIGGGIAPIWSRDGSRLIYRTEFRGVMGAAVLRDGDQLRIGQRRELVPASANYSMDGRGQYDVGPDGRLLMMRLGGEDADAGTADDASAPNQVVLVRNWIEELKERVPVP